MLVVLNGGASLDNGPQVVRKGGQYYSLMLYHDTDSAEVK